MIGFLVGRKGHSIFEGIYPANCRDDLLHSRLLLAAKVAQEAHLTPSLEARLAADLRALADEEPFASDALNGLAGLGTKVARDMAWEAVRASMGHPELSGCLGQAASERLCTEERLRWLRAHLRGDPRISERVKWTLIWWSHKLPRSEALRTIFSRLGTLRSDYDLLIPLVLGLDPAGVTQLIVKASTMNTEAILDTMQLLVVALHFGMQLTPDQNSLLIDRFPVGCGHILEFQCASLTNTHIAKVLAKWWRDDMEDRCALMSYAPSICARFPDRVLDDFLEAISGRNGWVRLSAGQTLEECAPRLRDSHVQRLVTLMRNSDCRPEVIAVVAAVAGCRGDLCLAKEALEGMEDPDPYVRANAMLGTRWLWDVANEKHSAIVDRNLRRATRFVLARIDEYDEPSPDFLWSLMERRAAIEAAAYIGRRARRQTIDHIIGTLDWYDRGWQECPLFPTWACTRCVPLKSSLGRIARLLDGEQVRGVLSRIRPEDRPKPSGDLWDLLAPDKMSDDAVPQLVGLLRKGNPDAKKGAYRLLRGASEMGLFSGPFIQP